MFTVIFRNINFKHKTETSQNVLGSKIFKLSDVSYLFIFKLVFLSVHFS